MLTHSPRFSVCEGRALLFTIYLLNIPNHWLFKFIILTYFGLWTFAHRCSKGVVKSRFMLHWTRYPFSAIIGIYFIASQLSWILTNNYYQSNVWLSSDPRQTQLTGTWSPGFRKLLVYFLISVAWHPPHSFILILFLYRRFDWILNTKLFSLTCYNKLNFLQIVKLF